MSKEKFTEASDIDRHRDRWGSEAQTVRVRPYWGVHMLGHNSLCLWAAAQSRWWKAEMCAVVC